MKPSGLGRVVERLAGVWPNQVFFYIEETSARKRAAPILRVLTASHDLDEIQLEGRRLARRLLWGGAVFEPPEPRDHAWSSLPVAAVHAALLRTYFGARARPPRHTFASRWSSGAALRQPAWVGIYPAVSNVTAPWDQRIVGRTPPPPWDVLVILNGENLDRITEIVAHSQPCHLPRLSVGPGRGTGG